MQSLRYRYVDIRMFHDDTIGGVLMLPIYHSIRQMGLRVLGQAANTQELSRNNAAWYELHSPFGHGCFSISNCTIGAC